MCSGKSVAMASLQSVPIKKNERKKEGNNTSWLLNISMQAFSPHAGMRLGEQYSLDILVQNNT